MQRYSAVQDKLKAMTDIKPSVLQDVAIIIEKFPCNKVEVPGMLENFVNYLKFRFPKIIFKWILFFRLGANNKKITITGRD